MWPSVTASSTSSGSDTESHPLSCVKEVEEDDDACSVNSSPTLRRDIQQQLSRILSMWTGPPRNKNNESFESIGIGAIEPPPAPPGRFQPGSREVELEELRQRGLAKLLNKHFTETTKKLAAEKAAADAALADLERRKAATSEFSPSRRAEPSNWDALYLSCHQWRNECRRKERETLLLYQRYVHKFGASGRVRPPTEAAGTAWATDKSETAGKAATGSKDGPAATDAPPSRNLDSSVLSAQLSAPPPPISPTHDIVGEAADKNGGMENSLEKFLKTGSVDDSFGEEEKAEYTAEEAEFRDFYRRQLEGRGLGAIASPPRGGSDGTRQPSDPALAPVPVDPFLESGVSSLWGNGVRNRNEDGVEEDDGHDLAPLYRLDDLDDCSVVSGLTSVNSAMTREILMDCEKSVVTFLKDEKDAIRRIIEEEDAAAKSSASGFSDSEIGSNAVRAADQAENMVRQMEEILNEFETKAKDDKATTSYPREFTTSNPDETWMIYYDETYQREYFYEINTKTTRWSPPERDGAAGDAPVIEDRSIPDADDMKPELLAASAGSDSRPMSRVAMYRRKQRRRRRRRRLMALAAVTAVSLAGAGYYLYTHEEAAVAVRNSYAVQLLTSLVPSGEGKGEARSSVDEAISEGLDAEAKRREKEEQLRREKEAGEKARKLEEERNERERKMEEERIRREEAEAKRAAEEKKLEAERTQRDKEAAAVALAARQQREEEERLASEKEAAAAKEVLRRPWGCNIPLSYVVHKRCRRLASDNPVFDLNGLVASMVQ